MHRGIRRGSALLPSMHRGIPKVCLFHALDDLPISIATPSAGATTRGLPLPAIPLMGRSLSHYLGFWAEDFQDPLRNLGAS
jgi:hypothetical protein